MISQQPQLQNQGEEYIDIEEKRGCFESFFTFGSICRFNGIGCEYLSCCNIAMCFQCLASM